LEISDGGERSHRAHMGDGGALTWLVMEKPNWENGGSAVLGGKTQLPSGTEDLLDAIKLEDEQYLNGGAGGTKRGEGAKEAKIMEPKMFRGGKRNSTRVPATRHVNFKTGG